MLPFRVRTALLLVLTAPLTACGSSSADATPATSSGSPDGGTSSPPPITDGAIKLSLPAKFVMMRGETTALKDTVERGGAFAGTVSLTIVGAPKGVSAERVDVSTGETSGELRIAVGAPVAQGDLAGVFVEANGPGQPATRIPLAASVRGRPGELDTTFGVAGEATEARSRAFAMDAKGRFYAPKGSDAVFARFTPDGAVDTTFQQAVLPMTAVSQLAAVGSAVYVCGDGSQIVVARLTESGALDTAYGGGAGKVFLSKAPAGTLNGCVFSATGRAAVSWSANGTNYLSWIDEAGVVSSPSIVAETFASTRGVLEGSLFTGIASPKLVRVNFASIYDVGFGKPDLGAGILAIAPVAGSSDVFALTTQKLVRIGATGAPVAGFASPLAVPQGAVTGAIAVQPKDGKLLVASGYDLTSVVTRLLPDGTVDTAFGTNGALSGPLGLVSHLAVQPDGRIVLVSIQGTAPVRRYWGD